MIPSRALCLIGFFWLGWAAVAAAAGPEQPFGDCPDCPEMVPLSGGRFVMGDAKGRDSEKPIQTVAIEQPFAIARTETTFEQWAACVAEAACRALDKDRDWGRGDRPVIYVTFHDAEAYVQWLAAKTGKRYRLPTEQEWEYAARGGKYGRVTGTGRANCHKCGGKAERKTLPVGQFPANPYGLLDMLGNVTGWTASCWRENHSKAAKEDCSQRVRRGGSWYFNHMVSRPAYRDGALPDHSGYDIGFRVALTLSP